MRHPSDINLALFAGAELAGWRRWRVGRHVQDCESCRNSIQLYRQDREELIDVKSQLPEFVNWDRLAGEMKGNIRVGLAAGECVAPRGLSRQVRWQHAAGAALAAGLLLGGWLLNIPHKGMAGSGPAPSFRALSNRTELQKAPGGVEIKAPHGALTLLHDGPAAAAIYTSNPDTLSVQAFNSKTGQITVQVVSYAE